MSNSFVGNSVKAIGHGVYCAIGFGVKKGKIIFCLKCGEEAYRCLETRIVNVRHFSFFHVDHEQRITCCRCIVEVTEIRTDDEQEVIGAQDAEAGKK